MHDHDTLLEQSRIASLLEMMPRGRRTLLDVGARDACVSLRIADRFEAITVIDLEAPDLGTSPPANISTAAGNVVELGYPDQAFDTVLCSEVLEHVPAQLLPKACAELVRVARSDVLIGVPYDQDIRVGRATCAACGKVSPPWGHLNRFTQEGLVELFRLRPVDRRFVASHIDRTNGISTFLMDLAGNPWGTYEGQHCTHCRKSLVRPSSSRTFGERLLARAATSLTAIQRPFVRESPLWIHILFSKGNLSAATATPPQGDGPAN